MTRGHAIAVILAQLRAEHVIAANGMISREALAAGDGPERFYMIGSMGMAAAIGLGVALARPHLRVVVLDGDGNALMGLGGMAMVAEQAPSRFIHVVLDNERYDTTGGQRSISDRVDLEKVACACGYRWTRTIRGAEDLPGAVADALVGEGPALLLVKVSPADAHGHPPRVPHEPDELARRFRRSLAGES